ncbi:MAG: nucleotidyltransferase family protein [Gemmatimonadetes bacterium]|nr:nucleotidyltransferase family protein [Gemmatimonadota bacterium]
MLSLDRDLPDGMAAADLAVRAAVSSLFETPPARIENLAEAEWARVAAEAKRLGLAALIHPSTETAAAQASVPAGTLAQLRSAHLWGLHTLRTARAQLAELDASFREFGVSALFLKGPVAAEELYPDPARRAMTDIDLLVRRRDVRVGRKILRSLGYRAEPEPGRLPSSKHLPPYVRVEALRVELHFELFSTDRPAGVDLDRAWTEARTSNVAGRDLTVLSKEDMLVHAGLHLAQEHGFERPFPGSFDLALIVDRWVGELDWDRALRIADEAGAYPYVRCALHAVSHVLGRPLPRVAEEAFPPDDLDGDLLEALRTIMLMPLDVSAGPPSLVREWNARRGFVPKARALAQALLLTARELAGDDRARSLRGVFGPVTRIARRAARTVGIAARRRPAASDFGGSFRQPVWDWQARAAAEARGEKRRRGGS